MSFLEQLRQHYPSVDFPADKEQRCRYYYDNPYFSWSDAIIYSCIIRAHEPRHIIEIGAGYSTACALDTLDAAGLSSHLLCIDPDPARLRSLLRSDDQTRCEIVSSRVEALSEELLTRISALTAGDIFFVDSSHVSKAGSDVNFIIHKLLPQLQPGVLIHFHDVFHNFEYPEKWIAEGVEFSEQYLLRSFLQYNEAFRIILMTDWMERHHRDWYAQHMPDCLRLHERDERGKFVEGIRGQSLWMTRKE